MTTGPGSLGHDPDQPLKLVAAEGLRRFARPGGAVGLAVSGGSDSMAMLHLMADVAPAIGVRLQVATVDHRLRPEAAAEAAEVGRISQTLGLPHEVLAWDHGPVAGNLMQAAREARYDLLADWARRHDLSAVMLAHTADDQAETFLMGLSRASGIDGLSGMRKSFDWAGKTLCRPFLQASRHDLRAYLSRHGIGWVDDPSNENPRFTRVQARQVMRALEPLGISVASLSSVVQHLSMAQSVLRDATAKAAEVVIAENAGSLSFDRVALLSHGPEITRRLLIGMVRWMSGAAHPPRESQIATLLNAATAGKDATLGGVRFAWKGDRCTVMREPRALGPAVPLGGLWDMRWVVTAPVEGEVRAVDAEGLAQIPNWRQIGLARGVALATPAIWQGDKLISAPFLQFGAPCHATLTSSFVSFLLSH